MNAVVARLCKTRCRLHGKPLPDVAPAVKGAAAFAAPYNALAGNLPASTWRLQCNCPTAY